MGMLDGKVALVTGGSRGIGKAIVQSLADSGARVAFTYRSSAPAAEAFRDELTARGLTVLAFQSDAASFKDAAVVVDAVVARLGRLDILVNNAGITKDTLLLRMSEEDWDSVIGTNLKGVFNFTKAAIRPMISQRSGKIINILFCCYLYQIVL
jgi:3-oxoacyl-[acyl-carrier protein] reductase